MSAPSGIKVPDSLTSAFSSALANANDIRALVFTIEGESFKHLTSVQPKGSFKDDISLLPPVLPSPKTPASFVYRLDSKEAGKWEWMMITYVPDDAGVRAKMLQASSRSGLMKSLGANNFKHDWFATSVSDLTPSALSAHLSHLSAPPPLSASEAALAEVREAEAAEAKRAALDPEEQVRRTKAVVGLGGKLAWGPGVQEALEKVGKRSDDGWVVTLEIPATNTASIALLRSEACTPSQLSSKLPPKSPCYVFYSFPTPPSASSPKSLTTAASARNTFQASQGGVRVVTTPWAAPAPEGEAKPETTDEPEAVTESPSDEKDAGGKGRVVFVYSCPPGSPVKYRMIYSTTVRSVRQDAMDKAGVDVVSKIETSDPADVTESHLKSSLPSKPTHSSSLPTPATASGPGPMFGRPRPTPTVLPVRSASQIPLPPSGPATPAEGGSSAAASSPGGEEVDDSKERIRSAFDAFGPRVGGGGGGGFARPRPAGRR